MKMKTNNHAKNWNSFCSANCYYEDINKIAQMQAKENYTRIITFNGK